MESWRERLQGIERLLGEEEVNWDALATGEFRVIRSVRSHDSRLDQLLMPSNDNQAEIQKKEKILHASGC